MGSRFARIGSRPDSPRLDPDSPESKWRVLTGADQFWSRNLQQLLQELAKMHAFGSGARRFCTETLQQTSEYIGSSTESTRNWPAGRGGKRHGKRLSPQNFPGRSSTGTGSKKISVLACHLRTMLEVKETSPAAGLPLRGHRVMIPKRSRLESILLLARGTGSPGTLPFFASFRDGGITTKLASGGGELQGLYRFPRSGDAGI
jgi:hypothetical protein